MFKYFVISFVFSLCISGCSFIPKANDVWTKKDQMIGKPVSELVACAGQPMDYSSDGLDRSKLYYGLEWLVSGATSWCVLNVEIEKFKVSRLTKDSFNHGGLTDGSFVCGLILDKCIGSGDLMDNVPHGHHLRKLVGPKDEAISLAKARGEKAKNHGIMQIFTLVAAPPTTPLGLASYVAVDLAAPEQRDSVKDFVQSALAAEASYKANSPQTRQPLVSSDIGQFSYSTIQNSPSRTINIEAANPTISVGGLASSQPSSVSSAVCPAEGNTVASIQSSIRCQCAKVKDAQLTLYSNGATCGTDKGVLVRSCFINNGSKKCGWS